MYSVDIINTVSRFMVETGIRYSIRDYHATKLLIIDLFNACYMDPDGLIDYLAMYNYELQALTYYTQYGRLGDEPCWKMIFKETHEQR